MWTRYVDVEFVHEVVALSRISARVLFRCNIPPSDSGAITYVVASAFHGFDTSSLLNDGNLK